MSVTGAAAKATVVPIGMNYGYNGIRHDSHDAVSVFLCAPLPRKRENQRSEAEAVTVGGEDRAASAGAASQRAGEEASGGSPGSAAGAASQRAGEEASGDEESSGAASSKADESLPNHRSMKKRVHGEQQ